MHGAGSLELAFQGCFAMISFASIAPSCLRHYSDISSTFSPGMQAMMRRGEFDPVQPKARVSLRRTNIAMAALAAIV